MSARVIPRLLAVAAAVTAVTVTACTATVDTNPAVQIVPTESTGTVVVDWTIRLRKDPGDCTLAAAASIQIHLFTQSGFDAGTFEQSCGAFSTSIVLNPDNYGGTAQLIDGAGNPRTTTVSLQPFSILGADQVDSLIDFPADSFF